MPAQLPFGPKGLMPDGSIDTPVEIGSLAAEQLSNSGRFPCGSIAGWFSIIGIVAV